MVPLLARLQLLSEQLEQTRSGMWSAEDETARTALEAAGACLRAAIELTKDDPHSDEEQARMLLEDARFSIDVVKKDIIPAGVPA